MALIPPQPIHAEPGSFAYLDYMNRVAAAVNQGAIVMWASVDKSGSSLSDISTRNHNQLTAIAGSSEGYHLSAAQYAALAGIIAGSVTSFNGRTGIVSLTKTDVLNTLTPKPTVTGSRGGNAALASLLTGLAAMGLITDSTVA